jgi:hypothetical protein
MQLQTTKDSAIKEYNGGCPDVKKSLENLFGKEVFIQAKITDRIKTFDDACKAVNIDPADYLTISEISSQVSKDVKSIQAYVKLIIIVRALNEGWEPNWKNQGEYKYYPWFDFSSGSGLSYYGYVGQYSISYVGSRLCFKSRELAEYAAKQFIDIYKEYFLI